MAGAPNFRTNYAPDWIRTSTPKKAQALNLPRMPIPPPGLVNIILSPRHLSTQAKQGTILWMYLFTPSLAGATDGQRING